MSEVKRYGHQQYNGKIWFEERDDGKFCSYDDYAELKAQRDALVEKVRKLEWDSVFIPNDLDKALTVMGVSLPVSKEEFNLEMNLWIQRLVDRVVRLGPELDAERKNLRAESLESFAHQQRVIADALPGHESQRSHRITACRAEDFAAQLRAGKGDD